MESQIIVSSLVFLDRPFIDSWVGYGLTLLSALTPCPFILSTSVAVRKKRRYVETDKLPTPCLSLVQGNLCSIYSMSFIIFSCSLVPFG